MPSSKNDFCSVMGSGCVPSSCTSGKKWLDNRVLCSPRTQRKAYGVGERFSAFWPWLLSAIRPGEERKREKRAGKTEPRFFSSVSIVGRFDSTPGGSNSNQSGIIAAVLRALSPPPPLSPPFWSRVKESLVISRRHCVTVLRGIVGTWKKILENLARVTMRTTISLTQCIYV